MTWKEIKKAVDDAGISEADEISVIECQPHDGNKTLHKIKTRQVRKARRGLLGDRARRGQRMHLLTSKVIIMTLFPNAVITNTRPDRECEREKARGASG